MAKNPIAEAEALVDGLSEKEKKAIKAVIRKKCPVLFVGAPRTGKTTIARALREMGISAYAPENISVIQLGARESEARLSQNDMGLPMLFENTKLVRLA